jgi:hypothetical protein
MMRHDLPEDAWTKSSYSGNNGGQCVEYQRVDGLHVAVGDSKDRSQGAFVFPLHAWTSFVNAVKDGEFDC